MACRDDYIAVFDSGLGGISVLRELVKRMPGERFLYYGDSARAPYGTRPTAEVREMTLEAIAALMPRGLKAVVIACNTATSAAICALRARYPDTIIVGIEPAIKPAADRFPDGRIIVMATAVTLREEKFTSLMEHYRATHDIVRLPCPKLVEFVEQGDYDGAAPVAYLRRTLLPCLTSDTHAIVLGCTHFPFLRPVISRLAGPDIAVLDGGAGTAVHTMDCLQAHDLLRTGSGGSVVMENSLGTAEIIKRSWKLLRASPE